MAQDRVRKTIRNRIITHPTTYYGILGLHPSASPLEIRRAYRDFSKRYHPDTTDLPTDTATVKFQQLNEAYATLSNPERRVLYDQKIGYSRYSVIQPPPGFNHPVNQPRPKYSSSAYLDPTDRPLSAGELFALFVLGLTFVGCLLLAIVIGLTRGDSALQVSGIHNYSLPTEYQLNHPSSQPPGEELWVTNDTATTPKFPIAN
ncbi:MULTISPECIES: J domain-containing protein [unclassified Coleofasciculus]|uniref:J domain-containing protein n=1 Tax=unclassified Coleofasciculus TaxID=2692782 RepID=UPI00187EBB8A|nr:MULTISPECIES: J domain-containing protein [unclassified Coleofasciculus]MBE9127089.1 J domain-containing protein [Coleofasciculus sp. LEGE 07081]MBE9150477.1 J domain-containing protein [Coleofasciculus sp. LEGE 07092]